MCAFSIPGNSDSTWSWRRSLRVQSHKTSPYFRCQFQVQASSTSDWLVLKGGFPQPPPWVWSFVKTAHRIQENTLLSILLAYYEEYNLEIPKLKRCFGQGTWKGCGASMPSSGCHPPRILMCLSTWKLAGHHHSGFSWRFPYIAGID